MKRKIVTDSSCDIWELNGVDFAVAPMTISTDNKHYVDNQELDVRLMSEDLAKYKGVSHTACPSVGSWLDCYEGYDEVFVVTLTGAMSGTYNSAMTAKGIYEEENENVKIHVFDSLSTGPEMRLLIEKLKEMIEEDLTFEEIVEKGQDYLNHTRLFFALKSLHNFAMNGRVSKAVASAIGVLNISIFATASEEGTIQQISKCRGEKKVVKSMIEHLENAGYHGGKVRISHADNLKLAHNVRDKILELYPHADIIVYPMGGLCTYYAEIGGLLVGCEC
ncbi:MAG: DegV family protein [Catenibacterium mitsuokai]|jgi:DegV family protein with EDD domain|uniref:DegV family protein n=1 Tax=Catenibacterium mitsuokai TaxID=100886 RepID=UPI0006C28FEC|nr:DegV family protein [Catenibacterium mitsuokai]MDD6596093.1 DegV family protein [Catenibacterium mitsuokai]MDY3677182.1 DegV family protein [Catenibacterium mitsuokai]CUO97069.1 Fatty acid-binding protein TM_1468 [Catenibacterium mitsuokai]CUP05124.1 Fatty acid-binding protein TM_1468 [Roseburia hominis]